MKTTKSIFLRIACIGVFGLLFANCEDGEIGAPGSDGIDGVDGINGIDGVNGIDGQNGIAFDELAQFGSINLTLEGTRPDDIPFTITNEFKFTASDDLEITNAVSENGTDLFFTIERSLSTPDDSFQGSIAFINLSATNVGEQNQAFVFDLDIIDYALIFDDLDFLAFSGFFESTDPSVSDFEITGFNFDNQTNALTFLFDFQVDGENNTTGNDISISGEVDVIVVTSIGNE
ncbi:hypothetical protein [Aquimarina pacifica]|uniref:hypothetical protein n=1 Tax=Aquimarina pacifica TaxID=1296415 RepID=UPI0004714AD1|nr:hypothetical protein [Aquimarina pacifica]